jgi:hypothetical protein
VQDAKALSSAIKDRRKDRAAKYSVPLPKVRGIAEEEMFKVIKTGKHKGKSWKRMVNKATFVGEGFTRKPVKLERFIRPMALRMTKANVTHREFDHQGLTLTSSRAQDNVPAPDPWRQEEPAVALVYVSRCSHQGYHSGGQRFGTRYGYHRWQGRLVE